MMLFDTHCHLDDVKYSEDLEQVLERMLQAGAEVWGIDQDPAARAAARTRLAPYADRLHIVAGNFRNAAEMLRKQGLEQAEDI